MRIKMERNMSTNSNPMKRTKPRLQFQTRSGAGAAALLFVLSTACGSTDQVSADAGESASIDAMQQDRWSTFAADFFEVYCHECHGPGDSLRDYSLLTTVTSERDKIRCGVSPSSLSGCTISARQFPVGSGPKPTDEDRMRLVEWLDSGAPE